MQLYEKLKTDFAFTDRRGSLVQLAHGGYEQINVLTTKAGVERGAHFHKETNEVFYIISGQLIAVLEYEDEKREEIFLEGDFFCIPPYVRHTLRFIRDTVMVAMYEHCVERADGTKDIYNLKL